MIIIKLSKILKEKNMTSKELAEKVGITEANLSVLRSGNARAVRFTTLNAICKVLDCLPGDVLTYVDDVEGDNHEF